MSAVTLRAHFDGRHIVLDEAFGLVADAKLLVTVLPAVASDTNDERAGWAEVAVQSLSRAYGADEPEYGEADIKVSV